MEHQEHDAVWLLPNQQWWLAAFWFTTKTDLTIDICSPPTQRGAIWSIVDLELDLYRNAMGQAGVVDQDEFAGLAASGLVTDRELAAASDTADRLLPLVQLRAEPFGQAARPWLQTLRIP